MNLPAKPLQVDDFSGGITDNILQGDPRRAAKLDNLLITADKKLIERPGLIPFPDESYFITDNVDRLSTHFSTANQTYLFAQVNSSLNILEKNYPSNTYIWNTVDGVAGNPALPTANSYSQFTFGEYVSQNYATTDGDGTIGTLPIKFYKDATGTWVAKTAGLPKSYTTGSYTDATLLAKCIANANDLRTSMIAHMQDSLYSTFTSPLFVIPNNYLHVNQDRYSLSYLTAITFTAGLDIEIPSPLPTPAPAATNEATLLTLVTALNLAYQHHMSDSMKGAYAFSNLYSPYYHMNQSADPLAVTSQTYGMPRGPGASVDNNSTPSSVENAATMLDDLYQKWNWHRQSVNTHSANNQAAFINKYPLSTTKIGTVSIGDSLPVVTANMSDVINFANNLKYIYNTHISADNLLYAAHKQGNNANHTYSYSVTLDDATDLDSAYNLIYWVRAMYTLHTRDSSLPTDYIQISCSATAGSASLTSVIRTDTGAAYDIGALKFIEFSNNTVSSRNGARNDTGSYTVAKIATSGSGTATLDRPMISTLVGTLGQATNSMYHKSTSGTTLGVLAQSTVSPELSGSTLGNAYYTLGTSVDSWLVLGEELFNALSTHATNLKTHKAGTGAVSVYNNLLYNVPYPEFQIPDVAQYVYAFFFSDEYVVDVGGLTKLTRGNPIFTDQIDCAISYPVGYTKPNQSAFFPSPFAVVTQRSNVLSNLPVLVNDGLTNYDLSNIKLNIYRSTDGGTTYFLLDQVANGTLTYTDTVNDTISTPGEDPLEDRQPIYTSGGVVGYDQPPYAKFMHIFNGTAYYGAIKDGEQFFPNRVLQAVNGIPDATPLSFSLDLDDDLTGLSSTKQNLIALCKTSLFRVSNQFNSLGQGSLEKESISDIVGCLNAKSIVQTEIGVFFAGTDGFYYTDGYQVFKVSLEIDDTYAKLTASEIQRRNIVGTYDTLNRMVWWSMREFATEPENSVSYILHLNMGVKPSAAFSVAKNFPYYQPASMTYFKGELVVGSGDGAILKMASYAKYDAIVDLNVSSSLWSRAHIPYDYTSLAIDLGTTFNRKWLTKIHVVGTNYGNMLFEPIALKDMNQSQAGPKVLAPVNYGTNTRWGAPSCIWGTSTVKWEYDGKMDLWRRFPRNTLRSDFMQVSFKPYYGVCYASSHPEWPAFSYVLVNSGTKVVTLSPPAGYSAMVWPEDVVGMFISFAYDNYQTSYEITDNSYSLSLTVDDPDGTLLNVVSGVAWQISGYKKEQKFSLSSYVIHYALLGDKNQKYPGAYTGDGEGNAGGNPT